MPAILLCFSGEKREQHGTEAYRPPEARASSTVSLLHTCIVFPSFSTAFPLPVMNVLCKGTDLGWGWYVRTVRSIIVYCVLGDVMKIFVSMAIVDSPLADYF